VFNGGAWLEIDGRRADVHYRDLDAVDREIVAAGEGRFSIEPLMLHLAGIPTYLIVAELAVKQVLRGQWVTNEKMLPGAKSSAMRVTSVFCRLLKDDCPRDSFSSPGCLMHKIAS